MEALFGFGGLANVGLTAAQAYKKKAPVSMPAPAAPSLMYSRPENLEALKAEWTVNDTTRNVLQSKTTDELDALFKHYLKAKKQTSIDFSRKRIAKEGFNVIDKAATDYLTLIKDISKEKAILMLAGKSEKEIQSLIAQTNKLVTQASIDATKVETSEERLEFLVEKEYLQFVVSLLKEVLQLKKNNKYVPSETVAPALNTSYLNERNFDVRKGLNKITLESSMGRNKNLTNRQINARRIVAMKMARGEPVTLSEKVSAGIVNMPKPAYPKPSTPKPVSQKPSMPRPPPPRMMTPEMIAASVTSGGNTRKHKHKQKSKHKHTRKH